MKLAITYENGNIFQHFGKTETFKIYEIQDQKVVSSEVISAGGAGHEALAGVLADLGVEALICGGLGAGAQAALSEAGIQVYPGVQGEADEAAEVFLKGELLPGEANCDHHGEEHSCQGDCAHGEEAKEGGCGCGGDSDCGSSCGGSCGSCGGNAQPIMEGQNAGKVCSVHYRGTFNDGTQFDSSYDRGEPLTFTCGVGQMIRGFDAAVVNMNVGEKVEIHLMPEEAYGHADPDAIFEVVMAELPGSEGLSVGQQVYLQNQFGQPFPVKVTAKTETHITFDANHEMAGKELNFQIELVEVAD